MSALLQKLLTPSEQCENNRKNAVGILVRFKKLVQYIRRKDLQTANANDGNFRFAIDMFSSV